MKDETRGSPEAPSYTPGPWEVVDEIFVDGPDGLGIFGGASTQRPDAESAANARLIAAAPGLLEFAQWMLKVAEQNNWGDDDLVVIFARAAIAKAIGNTP